MGIFSATKKVAGRVIDVRVDKWLGVEYLNETAERFKFFLTDIITPKKATYSESFEEAVERLELTEQDIEKRKKEFTFLFYFFMAISLVIILYALYVGFKGELTTSLISFCLTLYAFTQAFRFHFWLFQVKNRKLGCTLREWLNSKVYDVSKLSTKKELAKVNFSLKDGR